MRIISKRLMICISVILLILSIDGALGYGIMDNKIELNSIRKRVQF